MSTFVYVVHYSWRGENYTTCQDYDTLAEANEVARELIDDRWLDVWVEARVVSLELARYRAKCKKAKGAKP